MAALLCNCNSTCAVGQWCREQRRLLRQVFGPRHHLTPSDSLYRRLLPRLCAEQVEAVVAAWVRATRPAADAEAVAMDSKTVRGAVTAEGVAPHLLAFCTHETQETLLQMRVADKTNEIPVAQTVAPRLRWQGRVCTADALHTQTAFIAAIHALGGDVLLTLKDNQPTWAADLATLFAAPHAQTAQAHTLDCHRGRRELRQITLSTDLTAYLATLATHARWPHIAQVGRVTRRVTIPTMGLAREETVYLITTLRPWRPPRPALNACSLSCVATGTLRTVRTMSAMSPSVKTARASAPGTPPQILAALRNLTITLIHRAGASDIAASRRAFAYHPRRALRLLLR